VFVHRLFIHGPDATLDTLDLAGTDDSQIDVSHTLGTDTSNGTRSTGGHTDRRPP
jgi:hypothetical protein